MFMPPPLYLQLYSIWLMAEGQRMMLQMFSDAMDGSHRTSGTLGELGSQATALLPAPLVMPHVESTPV